MHRRWAWLGRHLDTALDVSVKGENVFFFAVIVPKVFGDVLSKFTSRLCVYLRIISDLEI